MPKHTLYLLLFLFGLTLSAIQPHDYFTWLLEVLPAILGCIVLICTYWRFRFTDMTYAFILIHCYVLFVGGHYTYAEVPLFDHLKDWMGSERNNYDKVGHFTQGFVPAMIVRELLLRLEVVSGKPWLFFLSFSVCLSISALYELLEWGVAEMTGESAEAFLGTQGYVWDTQSDMLYAAIGALCMLLFFAAWQNRQIRVLH